MTRALICCWLLAFAMPSQAVEPAMFRFSKPIDRNATDSETIQAVAFDSDVYFCTRNGFPDVRLFDAQDKETPFVLEKERKADYAVAGFRVEENAAEKTTIVYVTMRREPLTELILETPSRNFNRLAVVQTPVTRGVRTEWVDIDRGQVSLVDFAGYRKETLGASFSERRETTYRIVIHNEDSPPLAIAGVQSRGTVDRAIFLAAPGNSYRLTYGSDEADAPKYDAASVLAPLRQGQGTVEGRLGAEIANTAVVEGPVLSLRGLLNNKVFLGAVVVALVALLGWGLYQAARRINDIPKE